jgi:thiamine biosynthesis protein ThiI
LVSGGIDSPVASFLMMKRGMKAEFIHFQNKSQLTKAVENKVEQLIEQLSKYQNGGKLYIVPFDNIQKEIIKNVKAELRMLIYRRLMFMISEKIANKEKIKALVTGDSLAQVASQTLPNMEAVYAATGKLILTPLVGMNKNEIVGLAKKIGTYDISILPYGDCCSYFVAEHPETNAKIDVLTDAEKNIDKDSLVEEAVKNVKVVKF